MLFGTVFFTASAIGAGINCIITGDKNLIGKLNEVLLTILVLI